MNKLKMTFHLLLAMALSAACGAAPSAAPEAAAPAAAPAKAQAKVTAKKPAAAKPAPAAVAEPVVLQAVSASVKLEGDSTLHKYHSRATKIELSGQLLPSGREFAVEVASGAVKQLKAVIPVEGLKSDKDGLDKNLYQALKSKDFPEIVFEMSSYELKWEGAAGSAKVNGSLTVSGAKKDLVMDVKVSKRDGNLVFSGVQDLKMTDFGIKPPVMMMGMLKTADPVKITFEVELAPAQVTASAPVK